MNMLKTKDAADQLSVSQTTVKRWASTFPGFFPKDRFGHYIFSEHEIGLLTHIKDHIDQGKTLDCVDLTTNKPSADPLHTKPVLHSEDPSTVDMLSRIAHIERSLEQKADEVVSIQVLHQRVELEEIRQMIQQLAASLETIQQPNSKVPSLHEEIHPTGAVNLQVPRSKRGLLRSLFSFL